MSDLTQRVAGLSPEQLSLLLARLKEKPAVAARDEIGQQISRRVQESGVLPLSFAQQRLWFLEQLEPESALYNMSSAARLSGRLAVVALEQALREVTRRHESLRTSFVTIDGEPRQVIAAQPEWRLAVVDLSQLSVEVREQQARQLARQEAERPFDLAQGPLLRATLLWLSEGESEGEQGLLFTMHHIVSDGWSQEVLRREVTTLYQAFSAGRPSRLAELPVQYADYAVWQRQRLSGAALESELSYWRQQLAGTSAVLELPTDRVRSEQTSGRGATVPVALSAELTAGLRAVGRAAGATLFMTVLAALETLLWRYTGAGRVCVGTPVAGRVRAEVEGLIGLFVNTLVIAAEVRGGESFRAVVGRVREACLGAYAHQEVPFERLVEELQPKRSLSHSPLFPVMFILQNSEASPIDLPGVNQGSLKYDEPAMVRSDLDLYLWETAAGLSGCLAYRTDLFDAATVARMANRLGELVQAVVRDPDVALDDLVLGEPFDPLRLPLAAEEAQQTPLSYHQERLWFIDQFETGNVYESSPTYHNLPLVLRLEGMVDRNALESSINLVIERHAALRVKIVAADGKAFQSVTTGEKLRLDVVELARLEKRPGVEQVIEMAMAEAQRPFTLDRDLLVRASLFKIDDAESVLVVTTHHIVADRQSLQLIFEELSETYCAIIEGRPPRLPDLSLQYTDYARSQRLVAEESWEPLRFYWKWRLSGKLQALELPEDRTRPAVHTYSAARATFSHGEQLTRRIKTLAAETKTSAYAIVLAAFKVLLHRYARLDEIVVGTSESCRDQPETARLVGPFANLLVLRSNLGGNPTLSALLARVANTVEQARAHRAMPFDKLVNEIAPEKDMSRTALFDVLFQFEDSESPVLRFGDVTASVIDTNLGYGKYDLNLSIRGDGEGLSGSLVFNADIYDASTIRQMLKHFEVILETMTAGADQRIDDLILLSENEERRQLSEWNSTQASYPHDRTIHQLFEEQVKRTPLHTAVVFEGGRLTYRELDERANRLAHYLRDRGVSADVLVALCLNRSAEMIVALLGVLKAGGAYLPLDSTYPQDRLRFMLEDSGVTHLITTRQLAEVLPQTGASLVLLDDADHAGAIAAQPAIALDRATSPENLAYCIYTSGSTGRPKGVLVEHRNVVRLIVNDKLPFSFSASDVWTMFHSYCFDFSVWEMYGALLYGGKLVIVPEETTKDPALFLDLLARERVTVLNQTPTAFDSLARAALQRGSELALRYVIFGGEALHPIQLREWKREHPAVGLVNMYGITETTVHVTFKEVGEQEIATNVSNIGGPIPTTTTYVMDERLRLLPVGVPGEVCVGGGGVGRGYLKRDELTGRKFVPNPYNPAERIYRSGDLAKLLPNGELVYLGRIDDQVQIRGFRVEPGEVRSRLLEHPHLAQAEVVARKLHDDTYELIAYVVPSTAVSVNELRTHLSSTLPHYMVPSTFVLLNELPLTANGKVDRLALPDPEQSRMDSDYVAPRTPVEEALCAVWSQVLRIKSVGVDDNFFDLGGHSLLATQVVSRVRDRLRVELSLRRFFEAPTVAGMAHWIETETETACRSQAPPLQPVPRDDALPPSFAQQRLWFMDRLLPESATYNVPAAQRLQGALNVPALGQALWEVTRRHESLRTTFVVSDGEPKQVIAAAPDLRLAVVDLSQLNADVRERQTRVLARREAERPFDVARGPMLRATLLRLNDHEHALLFTMHHIVSDGWSLEVLRREVTTLYQEFSTGKPSSLAELPIQYADYAVWQRQWLTGAVLDEQLAYWKQRLANLRVLELPADRPRRAGGESRSATATRLLPAELLAGLKELSRQQGCSLFMTLVAVFQTLLGRQSGRDDVAVGTDIAGRNRSEVEGLIGFFVNQLVLRTDLSGNPSFVELLERVREVVLEAYAHQEVPFEKVVEALRPRREGNRTPLFDVKIVVQNTPVAALESGFSNLAAKSLGSDSKTAKFDWLLNLTETRPGLHAELEYNIELFDAASVGRFLEQYEMLLRFVVAQPEARLNSLREMLNEAERQRLIAEQQEFKASSRRKLKVVAPRLIRSEG